MSNRLGKVAHRHGETYHLAEPGATRTLCGMRRPILPAKSISDLPLCDYCADVLIDPMPELGQVTAGPQPGGG